MTLLTKYQQDLFERVIAVKGQQQVRENERRHGAARVDKAVRNCTVPKTVKTLVKISTVVYIKAESQESVESWPSRDEFGHEMVSGFGIIVER